MTSVFEWMSSEKLLTLNFASSAAVVAAICVAGPTTRMKSKSHVLKSHLVKKPSASMLEHLLTGYCLHKFQINHMVASQQLEDSMHRR